MISNPPKGMSRITPQLFYADVDNAIVWLQKNLGFVLGEVAKTSEGQCIYAELHIRESLFLVAPDTRFNSACSPEKLKKFSQSTLVYMDDVEQYYQALCERGGVSIVEPLEKYFWGDKNFKILDCEGHLWSFAEHVEDVDITTVDP